MSLCVNLSGCRLKLFQMSSGRGLNETNFGCTLHAFWTIDKYAVTIDSLGISCDFAGVGF